MQYSEQQLAAIKTTSKSAVIEAAPGSGKTATIVGRVAYLIEECKVSPFEILLITFTRLAATEMRERIEKRIGSQAHKITIGTFHAVGLNFLLRFGDIIGFKKEFSTVYGDFEEQFLLKEIAREMGIYNGKAWKIKKKDIDAVFNRYYETGEPQEDTDPVMPLFKALIQRTRENNSYTYGSILTGFKLLLPSIYQYLHFKHVICDESQDNSLIQWHILEMLRDNLKASLFAVQDQDQAIFSWRGGDPDYVFRRQDQFDIYLLETNYRSAVSVIDSAKRLIRNNTDRIDKTMYPNTHEKGCVDVGYNIDSDALVKTLIDMNAGHEVAVLARNHILLQKLDSLMTEAKIPHTYIGRKAALSNSEEFRRVHAFLKLMVNPFDNFSFLLIRELLDVSFSEYADIRVHAAENSISHYQAWKSYHLIESFMPHQTLFARYEGYDFKNLIRIMSEIEWPFETDPIFSFMREWEQANQKWRNEKCDEGAIQDYLKWLATWDISEEVKEENEGIQLQTIHSAKGLEFPVVIIAGCNEGIIPSKQAIGADDLSSERNLMYVAMTRAEKQLILTVRPESKEYHGKVYLNPVSRFIAEAGG